MTTAYFYYRLQNLTLNLFSSIIGDYTSLSWSVTREGATAVTSTLADFSLDLAANSSYKITLSVVSNGGTSSKTVRLETDSTSIFPKVSLQELILGLLPKTTDLDISSFQTTIMKWQNILAEGLKIPTGSVYCEKDWPLKANMLIAYLTVRDTLTNSANSIIISQGVGSGAIKSVATGPTSVERFSPADSYKQIFGVGGIFEAFSQQICGLAFSLGVHISGCTQVQPGPISVMYNSDNSYAHKYIIGPPEFKARTRQ